jgi:ketosteroid isomerase-like protein
VSKENVEVVRGIYQALVRRDLEAIEALAAEHLAPDFEFESILTGQAHKGARGLKELAGDLWDTLDYVGVTEELIDAGPHVVVVLRFSGRGGRSGAPIAQQVATVWTFEGDQSVRSKSFTSRAEALEAVGLRE